MYVLRLVLKLNNAFSNILIIVGLVLIFVPDVHSYGAGGGMAVPWAIPEYIVCTRGRADGVGYHLASMPRAAVKADRCS